MSGFSIVIPMYNGGAWIEACLQSSLQEGVKSVVVVDNASADGSGDIVRRFVLNDRRVVLVQQKKNKGFTAAVNFGCQMCLEGGSRWIMLLNQDAKLEAHSITELSAAASSRFSELDIFTPCQRTYDGCKFDPVFARSLSKSSGVDPNTLKSITPLGMVNGASMCFSPKLFKLLGGFDEGFFMYGEDTDFVRRAKMLGAKCFAVMSAVVHHEHTAKDQSSPSVRFGLHTRFSHERLKLLNTENPFAKVWLTFLLRSFALPILSFFVAGRPGAKRTLLAYAWNVRDFRKIWAARTRQKRLIRELTNCVR